MIISNQLQSFKNYRKKSLYNSNKYFKNIYQGIPKISENLQNKFLKFWTKSGIIKIKYIEPYSYTFFTRIIK